MNAHFPRQNPTAIERVQARFSRTAIFERFASSFERSPLPFSVLAFLIPTIAIVSALGLSGALGLPLLIALPIGAIGVFWQGSFFAMLRDPAERSAWMFAFLLAITFWNAISLSAGIVALKPDAMGKQQIERQLETITQEASERASTLDALAGRLEALSDFNQQQAERENSEDKADYAPTCPSSTEWGPGPISTWRKNTADRAAANASRLRNAATEARAGAVAAQRAKADYTLENHDAAMDSIAAAVTRVSRSTADAGLGSLTAELQDLDGEVEPSGICPDPQMLRLIRQTMPANADYQDIAFSPIPRPSEAEAVADLWQQLISLIRTGSADLSLYALPLMAAPLIDVLYMTMLAKVLPKQRKLSEEELLADAMNIDPDEMELLHDAMAAAASDPDWNALVGKVEHAGGRWFRVLRVYVDLDDWATLFRMQHLAQRGRVRDGGIVQGRHVFVLRPNFLRDRFDQLVRRWITSSRYAFNPGENLAAEQPQ